MRIGEVERKSLETYVMVKINLDESDKVEIDSGIGFFDHMLSLLLLMVALILRYAAKEIYK